jgi:hypothetical protein
MQAYLLFVAAFFLLSAHRFLVRSDRRLLPSGVSRLGFLPGGAGRLAAGGDIGGAGGKSVSS